MTDSDTLILAELDQLAPLPAVPSPDWDDVLRRVAPPAAGPSRFGRRRPLLVAAIVLAVTALPVGALGVAKSDPWWFLRDGMRLPADEPVNGKVVVVKTGSWNGAGWVLTAFRSRSGSLCYQVTETANGRQASHPDGAAVCQPLLGTPVPGRKTPLTIGFQGGSRSPGGLPRYIAGPVVSSAREVVVHLNDGTVVRTPTFAAPAALGMPIRFYATTVPAAAATGGSCRKKELAGAAVEPARLVGLDASGRVVASLTPLAPGLAKKLAALRCNPPRQPIGPRAGTASLEPVARFAGPYGGVATLFVGDTFPMRLGKGLLTGRIRWFVQPSRCWEVTLDRGGREGGCQPVVPRRDPTWGYLTDHDGRDSFVVADQLPRTGPPVARIELELANGKVLSAQPIDGVAVFAIPADALSTVKSQRGFLVAYDAQGHELLTIDHFNGRHFYKQAVYYRSCPRGSSCYSAPR